jgi:hypothetical protein
LIFFKTATGPDGVNAGIGARSRTGILYALFEASNNRILAKRKRNFALHACRSVFSAGIQWTEIPEFGREQVPKGSMSWL